MKNVIAYFLIVIIAVCICYFGPIKNINNSDFSTVTIQTYQVEILHLDIDTISDNEKRYYASVIDRRNDFTVVVEIPETRYVNLKVGDSVELQKESFYNDDTEVIRYSIVGNILTNELCTLGGKNK